MRAREVMNVAVDAEAGKKESTGTFVGSDKAFFSAEDVRQYVYCPRIIYFRYVLRSRVDKTVKMGAGTNVHDDECRRKGKEELECGATRYYNVFLVSEQLGLSALLDCVEVGGDGSVCPVDIKVMWRLNENRETRIRSGHLSQLVAQALLLEEQYGKPVSRGIIEYVDYTDSYGDHDDERKRRDLAVKRLIISITTVHKLKVLSVLERMQRIVAYEIVPKSARHEHKCIDCEYRNICRRA